MTRTSLLAVGALLAVTSACALALAVFAGQGDWLGPDRAWLEPYLGSGGAVAAGIGLVTAALILGIGMGHWRDPRPVPTSTARHHEGLQG